jgi:hypothetical protein
MLRRSPASLAALLFLVALPGCGSLDTQTNSVQPIAKINGTLDNPTSLPIDGPVRIAVIWQAVGGVGFNVAEDLPVQPVFPSSFTIEIDDPPPLTAMSSGAILGSDGGVEETLQLALGTVVAYVDKNGNGKLDLVPTGASSYVDQILATDTTYVLDYFTYQGTIQYPPGVDAGHPNPQGYSLEPACMYQFPGYDPWSLCPTQPPPCEIQDLPIDTPITLTVSDDPQVNAAMCLSNNTNGWLPVAGYATGRPATYPSPCDPNLECSVDGKAYIYQVCTETQGTGGLCEVTSQTCTSVSAYYRPDPVPSDWPCMP